jgi:hypothetical protein
MIGMWDYSLGSETYNHDSFIGILHRATVDAGKGLSYSGVLSEKDTAIWGGVVLYDAVVYVANHDAS